MSFEALGYTVVGIYDGGEVNTTYHSKIDVPSTINLKFLETGISDSYMRPTRTHLSVFQTI